MSSNAPPPAEIVKVSSEKQAELLYDHYKESISAMSSLVGKRTRMAIFTLLTLAVMVFQGTDPVSANSLASEFITNAAGGKDVATKLNMDPRFISSLMWFLLATLAVQVYGYSLLVELQSAYLKRVETTLDEYIGRPLISCRRLQRPRYLRHANFLYAQVYMALLSLVVLGKIYLEMKESLGGETLTVVFALIDFVMALVIFCYGYMFIRDFRWLEKHGDEACVT